MIRWVTSRAWWPFVRAIVTTLLACGVIALVVWVAWGKFGRQTIKAQVVRITASWRRSAQDASHPTIENPLTVEQLEAEREKLRNSP